MIGEAIDTALTLGWWLLGWTVVFGVVGTIALLTLALLGGWAATGLWRGVVHPSWGYGRTRARIYAARRVRAHTGHTGPSTYKEAA
ncbi:hypothetical protein G9272_32220 [Streptomyces asoensis]|uniref:Uncharacterized protein n=1 Tax=Streptomyces asoensis TaxID=249586 RepID=A0A6M4WYF3_9ACTN|nr:hypothetical protein [Streptomyces asoensis]QJT04385.1 hypothetical protein G9272_32220 [Streptomyces asoensis]